MGNWGKLVNFLTNLLLVITFLNPRDFKQKWLIVRNGGSDILLSIDKIANWFNLFCNISFYFRYALRIFNFKKIISAAVTVTEIVDKILYAIYKVLI